MAMNSSVVGSFFFLKYKYYFPITYSFISCVFSYLF